MAESERGQINIGGDTYQSFLRLAEYDSYAVPIGNTNTTLGAGQNNELFNSGIAVPPTDQLMFLEVDSQEDGKLASFLLALDFFDEITAAAPVTWTASANGTALVDQVINPTASRVPGNYRQFIVGNRLLYLGKSTGANPTILWGVSNIAVVLSMTWHQVIVDLQRVNVR